MAILPIRLAPDPILRRTARPVRDIDEAVRKLARDMLETLEDARGIGLAGNQVGVLRRVVALHVPDRDPFAIINPEIRHREGERRIEEGCLSFPGYLGMVTRAMNVTAGALTLDGEQLEMNANEVLAQALEHEIDHLNGILFIDHIRAHEDLWKPGADAGPHDHDDIDFEHEAAHGRIASVSESPSPAEPVTSTGSRDGAEELAIPDERQVYGHFSAEQVAALEAMIAETRERLSVS